jgi:L-rhamnose-H+ transport protein
MFYGMGATRMGAYDFGSWTLHMAFIIVFNNLSAIRLGEWRETRPRTLRLIVTGIAIVFLSTLLAGLSNYLASDGSAGQH